MALRSLVRRWNSRRCLDLVGIRRNPLGLQLVIAVPRPMSFELRSLTGDTRRSRLRSVEHHGAVSIVNIYADDLAASADLSEIIATTRWGSRQVGRRTATCHPAVTMPATVLHVDGQNMVTTRLTNSGTSARLHVMKWTA